MNIDSLRNSISCENKCCKVWNLWFKRVHFQSPNKFWDFCWFEETLTFIKHNLPVELPFGLWKFWKIQIQLRYFDHNQNKNFRNLFTIGDSSQLSEAKIFAFTFMHALFLENLGLYLMQIFLKRAAKFSCKLSNWGTRKYLTRDECNRISKS